MKTGRPRRASPEDLARAVDSMIENYQETKDITCLHDYKLLEILKVSPRTLERYYDGSADRRLIDSYIKQAGAGENDNNISSNNIDIDKDGEYTKLTYGDSMKKLIMFRQLVTVGAMTSDRFNSGWIFLSKQPHYGGFQDVQREKTETKADITVTIKGPDGGTISG